MPISRHPIEEEFPEHFFKLRDLKKYDSSFSSLVSEYDQTDKKIHGLECQLSPVSDHHIGELKRRRLSLKEAIQQQLVNIQLS